jgi:hypothetical protein
MKQYESMKEAAGEQRTSIIPEIADRLHLRPSTVYKWTQPSEDPTDSGQRGPLGTLMQYMESCLILGRPRSSALAPLSFLNNHFGQVCFSIPEHVRALSPDDLNKELLRCMKDAGEVIAEYQKAIKDARISKREAEKIGREVWVTVTEFMTFLHCLKEAAK